MITDYVIFIHLNSMVFHWDFKLNYNTWLLIHIRTFSMTAHSWYLVDVFVWNKLNKIWKLQILARWYIKLAITEPKSSLEMCPCYYPVVGGSLGLIRNNVLPMHVTPVKANFSLLYSKQEYLILLLQTR